MKKNLYSLVLVSLILFSCSPIVQKVYVATSPNVNYFERPNEKNLKISLFANHFEAQSNFVIKKNFGLSAGFNGSFRGQYGGEIAGKYFNKFDYNKYFEVQTGYGYFRHTNDRQTIAGSALAGERGTWFRTNSNVVYHKVFVQPTYFFLWNKVAIGLALKISANYYENFYYYQNKSEQDYTYLDFFHETNFKHKWNVFFEPAIRLHFNHKFFIQLSGLFSNNMLSVPTYYAYRGHEGGIIEQKQTGIQKSPDHLHFLFTLGYEIKWGTR